MNARAFVFAAGVWLLSAAGWFPSAEATETPPHRSHGPVIPETQEETARPYRIVTHAPGGPLLESPVLARLDYYRALHEIAENRWTEAEELLAETTAGDPSLVRAHLLLAAARVRRLEPTWILSAFDGGRALAGNFRAQSLLAANAVIFLLFTVFLVTFAAASASVLRALPSLRHAVVELLPPSFAAPARTLYPIVLFGSIAILFRPWGWGPGTVWVACAGILLAWKALGKGERTAAAVFFLLLLSSPALLKLAVHTALPATPGTTIFALSGTSHGAAADPRDSSALSPASGDSDVLFALALLERERGNRQKALDLYREILESDGPSAPVYNNMGNLFFLKGDVERAFSAYRQALALGEKRATTHYNLGRLYLETFAFDEARREFSYASELDFSLIRSLSHEGMTSASRTLVDDSLPAVRLWERLLSGGAAGEGIGWGEAITAAARTLLPPGLPRIFFLAAILLSAFALGQAVPQPTVCARCGKALCRRCRVRVAGTNRCPDCIAKGKDPVWNPRTVLFHRPVSLSLSLLLPGMGHFYLGRRGRGLAYASLAVLLLLARAFRGAAIKPFPILQAADLAPIENLVFAWLFVPLYLFVLFDALRLSKRVFRTIAGEGDAR
ncbi:MAG: tetratricopeptide repeat protein [Candidatus Eisenbacteria bacterium]|nr:tetratricopeptide repeat protein [Candidatus Eisenbacteria bacterium]